MQQYRKNFHILDIQFICLGFVLQLIIGYVVNNTAACV